MTSWPALALLVLAALASSAAAAPPVVDGVSPSVGVEGDLFSVFGSGFDTDPDHHAVFVDDGDGGVPAEVVSASSTELVCRLGAAGRALTGGVRVWAGATMPLPDRTVSRGPRSWQITLARWFAATAAAASSPDFEVAAASPDALGSIFDAAEPALVLEIPPCQEGFVAGFQQQGTPLSPQGPDMILVEEHDIPTDREGGGGGEGGGASPSPFGAPSTSALEESPEPGVGGGLRAALVAGAAPCGAVLAADLGAIYQEVFGPLGLAVEVRDRRLLLAYPGMTGGFAVIHPER